LAKVLFKNIPIIQIKRNKRLVWREEREKKLSLLVWGLEHFAWVPLQTREHQCHSECPLLIQPQLGQSSKPSLNLLHLHQTHHLSLSGPLSLL